MTRAYVVDVDLGRALQQVPSSAHVVGIAYAPQRRGGPVAWHVAYESP